MAHDQMTAQCPNCGQKLRDDWLRCPRCRELVEAAATVDLSAEAAASGWPAAPPAWQPIAIVAAIGIVAVAAVGFGLSSMMSDAAPAPSAGAVSERIRGSEALPVSQPRPVDLTRLAQHKSEDERRIGYAAYASGDLDAALARFTAAVEAKPDDPEARNNLGQVLVRLERTSDAMPHFDEAVRLDPHKWAYRFNRARAFATLKEFPRAIDDYRVAADLFPDDYATHFNLGLVYLAAKQYAEAVETLERAATLAPGDPSFLISLGTAYVGVQQPDKARATFERFLQEASPDDPEVARVKDLIAAFDAARAGA